MDELMADPTTAGAGAPPPRGAGPSDDELFLRVVEAGVDGVAILDEDGAIAYANPAAGRLLGRPAGSLLGRPLGQPIVAGGAAELDLPGDPGARVVELRAATGRWRGRPATIVGLREVTAYRRLAEARRRLAEAGAALARSLDTARDARDRSPS